LELGLPGDAAVIGNVGNFTAKKDHSSMLRALAGASEGSALAGAHLVLIGSGPLEGELRTEAEALGLTGRVTVLGSRNDVFEQLPLLDVFCHSSRFEGLPIALVEAMATGVACVATAVGGIPEILVDGENGRLVAPGRPEALGRALNEVLTDPDQAAQLGRKAAESAQGLDLRTSVERLQELYLAAHRRAGTRR
jgi:glycosyltransferase involved in cell wall biosynthesis